MLSTLMHYRIARDNSLCQVYSSTVTVHENQTLDKQQLFLTQRKKVIAKDYLLLVSKSLISLNSTLKNLCLCTVNEKTKKIFVTFPLFYPIRPSDSIPHLPSPLIHLPYYTAFHHNLSLPFCIILSLD